MTTTATKLTAPYVTVTCCVCDTDFQVPDELYRVRRSDHLNFWCPLGHPLSYPRGLSETQRLRNELDAERARAEFWRVEEERRSRELSAAKGQVTRLKNRAKAGVCPCCNRSFVQLARHMAVKHPDFGSG